MQISFDANCFDNIKRVSTIYWYKPLVREKEIFISCELENQTL